MRKSEWSKLHDGMVVYVRCANSRRPALPFVVLDSTPVKVSTRHKPAGRLYHEYRDSHLVHVRPLRGVAYAQGLYRTEEALEGGAQALNPRLDPRDAEGQAWMVDTQSIENLYVGERSRTYWDSEADYKAWTKAANEASDRARAKGRAVKAAGQALADKAHHAARTSRVAVGSDGARGWMNGPVRDFDSFVEWYQDLSKVERKCILVEFTVRPHEDLLRPECPVCEGAGCPECDHQGLQFLVDEEGDGR